MSDASARSPSASAAAIQIGEWRLDARGNELRRGAHVMRLEHKATQVLVCLAERPGEVRTREELLERIWPGVVVGGDALTQPIIKLRRALGDDSHSPRYIDTIPKRGYRLIAPVSAEAPATPASAAGAPRPGRAKRIGAYAAAAAAVAALAALLIGLTLRPMPWPLAPLASRMRGAPAASSIPTVAVLLLANLSGDRGRDYFSDGVTEDLINALGRFSGLRAQRGTWLQGPARQRAGDSARPGRTLRGAGQRARSQRQPSRHGGTERRRRRGSALLSLGRVDEAITILETARRFEPHPMSGRGLNLAVAYYIASRYAEASMQADAVLTTAPRNGYAYALKAAALARSGKIDDARSAAEQVRRLDPLFDAENFATRFVDPKYTDVVRAGLREAGL